MNFEIVFATNNPNKLKEARQILSPFGVVVYGLKDLNLDVKAKEDGHSYEENAYKKASAVLKYTTFPIFADDSGLEIESLNNFPGLHSSRYIDQCGSNIVAMSNLYEEVESNGNDKATFKCCICLLNTEDKPLYFSAEVPGHIVPLRETSTGFGYDAFFRCDEAGITYSEMSEEEKNTYSHRGKALRKMLVYLRVNGLIGK